MDEFREVTRFEECLSWIDAIVSLCKNIDSTCSRLDNKFPCEDNYGGLLSYVRVPNDDSSTSTRTVSSRTDENGSADYERCVRKYLTNKINDLKNVEHSRIVYRSNTPTLESTRTRRNRINKNIYTKLSTHKNYRLTIRGRSKKDINNASFYRMYQMESEVIKRLGVGEKICVFRTTSNLFDMEVEKNTGDYDFLLDMPFMIKPDTNMKHSHYKSDVAGVYWDKRSWIASWYLDGKRQYKSFSSKLYGFYRSKYLAIQTRLSNIYSIESNTGNRVEV